METLKKAWAWVKKNWAIFVAALVAIAGFVLYRRAAGSFKMELDTISKAHEDQLKKIEAATKKRDQEHADNVKKLEDELKLVNEKYAVSMDELKKKNAAAVEKLVEDYSDDPEEIAKLLAERTGATILLTTSKK